MDIEGARMSVLEASRKLLKHPTCLLNLPPRKRCGGHGKVFPGHGLFHRVFRRLHPDSGMETGGSLFQERGLACFQNQMSAWFLPFLQDCDFQFAPGHAIVWPFVPGPAHDPSRQLPTWTPDSVRPCRRRARPARARPGRKRGCSRPSVW